MNPSRLYLFVIASSFAVAYGFDSRTHAEDAAVLEVHEWSVWIGEPQARGINSVSDYLSAMPGVVETDRSRRRDPSKPPESPVTPLCVMTLYGPPPEVVDVDLKISTGRPVAQWPKSEGKSNRLRWLDLKTHKELTNKEAYATIPEGHWFHRARELGGLFIEFKKGRIERFLTYDLELQATLPLRLDGGPDQFKIANIGKFKLHDILLIVPDEKGRRVGWLDTASAAEGATGAPANNPGQPAGQPNASGQPATKETLTDIPLSDCLALDSDEFTQKTSGELRKRLRAAGMTEAEVELLHSLYAKQFFEAEDIQIVFRMPKEALDELTPLAIEPENAKITRVALVVARKVDPRLRDDVQKLITELGDASYTQREKAEKRLKELGRLAIPNLKDALKHKDLEVVIRAERLLLGHKEQLPAE